MAGIWDRIVPSSDDRCSVHLLKAAIYCAVRNVFTDAQIAAMLDSRLNTPLSNAAKSDLSAVRTAITNAATLQAKIDILERFDALNIMVEMGALTNEATYRSELGL